MKILLQIPLTTDAEQSRRLLDLQAAFAEVCNALAPQVQATRCWNRVALHHMAYKSLREKFPAIGSQMVCNAIYSVSRTCRHVFQRADSPFNITRLGAGPLPLLNFSDTSPVYFDRHTLSIKKGQLSMYTLDGRMRFQLALSPEDEGNFQRLKLNEIILSRRHENRFLLSFTLSDDSVEKITLAQDLSVEPEIPEYIVVHGVA